MRKTVLTASGLVLLAFLQNIASAQVALPSLPELPPVNAGQALGSVTDLTRLGAMTTRELGRVLASARIDRLTAFVRHNRRDVEMDAGGNPSVRGELVATGITAEALAQVQVAGFKLVEQQQIEGLALSFARLAAPAGMPLRKAQSLLARLAPGAEVSANQIYFASGDNAVVAGGARLAPAATVSRPTLGIIDGGVAAHVSLNGAIEQRGFVASAPSPSVHGTAVASLIAGRSPVGSAAPGAALLAADVYGTAPSGGNAIAIAQALGWLTARRVPVVTISLVGPDNPLLRAAVRSAQGRGVVIVAAVGNDGPAAPPSYPASWPGVLAVTGTDQRGRVLPEAGRALHVDFAAPASGFKAATPNGGLASVRGTSYAAPLVAGRLALLYQQADVAKIQPMVSALIAEAVDLGPKGRDSIYGHGLICGACVAQ